MKNIAPRLDLDVNLYLRKPLFDDIQKRFEHGRPLEFRKMCGGSMETIPTYTMQDAKDWFEAVSKREYEWMIIYNNEMVGTVRLFVQKADKRARFAIGIFDESLYGYGIGTKVGNAVLQFAFEELNLHRVDLRVLEFNARAIRSYKKIGFVKEGIERDSALIDGVYYSDVMMSILEHEFFKED